jgi:hypothetical protein
MGRDGSIFWGKLIKVSEERNASIFRKENETRKITKVYYKEVDLEKPEYNHRDLLC